MAPKQGRFPHRAARHPQLEHVVRIVVVPFQEFAAVLTHVEGGAMRVGDHLQEHATLSSTFPIVVPSLSWQKDGFLVHNGAKLAFSYLGAAVGLGEIIQRPEHVDRPGVRLVMPRPEL